jgi:hypothetical protein
MSIENFCEFIRKIHADPLAKIEGLSIRDFYALQDHVNQCEECLRLVDEVNERYKDIGPGSSSWDQASLN